MTTKPGDLVIPSVRFALHSRRIGLVLGGYDMNPNTENPDPSLWLVMWIDEGRVKFTWHLDNALLVIDDTNTHKAEERRLA